MATPLARKPRSGSARWITVVTLALLAGTLAIARLHTFDEPLERDLTTYAVIGHELLAGRELYSDLWDHKPPAIHLTFAAAEAVAGYGAGEVYLLNVLAGIATTLGVWAAAVACTQCRTAGLLAAAFWVATSGDLALQANQPNTEAFLNACLIWALALLLPDRDVRAEVRPAAAAGVLFALASLYKPVAVAVAVALACVLLLRLPKEQAGRRRAIANVALLVLPGAVGWFALAAWFGASGRLSDVVAALVTFNRAYAGGLWENLVAGLTPSRLVPPEMFAALPLAVVTVIALVWRAFLATRARPAEAGAVGPGVAGGQRPVPSTRTSIDTRERVQAPLRPASGRAGGLIAAYAVGVAGTVMLTGRFYPHYYQLWLPILAVAVAWALAELQAALKDGAGAVLHASGAALLVALVWLQIPSYFLSSEEWSRRKYGTVFVATRHAAVTIERLLAPGETFYEWGAETGLYFYTRRPPPAGVFFNYPLLQGPLVGKLSARVIRDLAAHPPELVVVSMPQTVSFSEAVMKWVAAHYVPLPGDVVRRAGLLLARRGGALEARLGSRGGPAAR